MVMREKEIERKQKPVFLLFLQESVLDQPISNGDSCQYLEAEKEKFNAAIDTLDNVLIRLEQLCLSTDRSSIENDVSSIILSIDSQISSLFKQLLNSQ